MIVFATHQLILGVGAAFLAGLLLGIWLAGWLYEEEETEGG
jgi:hypothetical protein